MFSCRLACLPHDTDASFLCIHVSLFSCRVNATDSFKTFLPTRFAGFVEGNELKFFSFFQDSAARLLNFHLVLKQMTNSNLPSNLLISLKEKLVDRILSKREAWAWELKLWLMNLSLLLFMDSSSVSLRRLKTSFIPPPSKRLHVLW